VLEPFDDARQCCDLTCGGPSIVRKSTSGLERAAADAVAQANEIARSNVVNDVLGQDVGGCSGASPQ
jgi:hypothetical protein